MNVKIILFSFLMCLCVNNIVIAEEQGKQTSYTWLQWFSKGYVLFRGSTLGFLAGLNIASQISYEETLPVYAVTCATLSVLGGVIGGYASNELANKLIEKPEENKEPNVLSVLLQAQLNTKENNATCAPQPEKPFSISLYQQKKE